jgi:hypothetical protein
MLWGKDLPMDVWGHNRLRLVGLEQLACSTCAEETRPRVLYQTGIQNGRAVPYQPRVPFGRVTP